MQKTSKNSKKFQNVTKKSINSDTVPYCKTIWAGGCWVLQEFHTSLLQKMPFAFILHFPFFKNHIFALKNSPPGEVLIVL